MKASVDAALLRSAISHHRGLDRSYPVFAEIEAGAHAGSMSIIAADRHAAIEAVVPADGGTPGTARVRAGTLAAAVSSATGPVGLSIAVDDDRLDITAGNARVGLPQPASELPILDKGIERAASMPETGIDADPKQLADAIALARVFVHDDASRPVSCVSISPHEDGGLEVAATNLHSLSSQRIDGSVGDRVLLPKQLLSAVGKIEDSLAISCNGQLAAVTGEVGGARVMYVSAQHAARDFPGTWRIVQSPKAAIVMDSAAAIASLAALRAAWSSGSGVDMSWDGEAVRLWYGTDDADGEAMMGAAGDAPPIELMLKADITIDGIRALDCKEVEICPDGRKGPMIVMPRGDDSRRLAIMPMVR